MHSSAVIALLIIFNAVVILDVALLLIKNDHINLLNDYYIFGGLVFVVGVVLYMRLGAKYEKILTKVKSYSQEKNSKLKSISIMYSLVSVVVYLLVMYKNVQNLIHTE